MMSFYLSAAVWILGLNMIKSEASDCGKALQSQNFWRNKHPVSHRILLISRVICLQVASFIFQTMASFPEQEVSSRRSED